MIGYIDISETSASDPGQSMSLTPYNNMKSFYFDDSLYENKMHYRINEYLKDSNNTLNEYEEELVIKCDNEEEYNKVLDILCHEKDGKFRMYGTTNDPLEIIVEKDPRENYRKFDEENFLMQEENK